MKNDIKVKYTFCRICEVLCGLKVTLENDEIIKIEPDRDNVSTEGFCCIKGTFQHKIYSSPDRLRYPMKREGSTWTRISWDQAFKEIGEKVKNLRINHGPDSIALYVGTAAGFDIIHPAFAKGFADGVGTRSLYAPHTQDCANKFRVAEQMYGFPFTQPFPDIANTRFLLVVGANPAISKFSFLQLPNPSKKLKAIEERGGRVVFIDPRKTESARMVGEHIFIRPDTDIFFYLSFLRELLKTADLDMERIRKYMVGFDTLSEISEVWTPERTEKVTMIPADTLRKLVSSYVQAESAALYCSTGVNMGSNGTLAFWIQEIINAVSGNLDRKGGTLVGSGIKDFPSYGAKKGLLLSKDKSRIGSFGAVSDCFPGGILADEILTPGDGQVRALFVTGGNPINTMANSPRLMEAFKELDLLVVTDILRNETASLAHYALPTLSFFEQPGIPFIFPLFLGLQYRPYLQATEKIVNPDGEQRHAWEIYTGIAAATGVKIFGSSLAQAFFNLNMKLTRAPAPFRWLAVTPERMFSLILRGCGQAGFKKLLRSPHGILREPHRENSFLGKRVHGASAKVNLAPKLFTDSIQKINDDYQRELDNAHKLKLITRRAVRTHNSWMHNIEDFVNGKNNTNYLYMHRSDAEKRGIAEESYADVSSDTGAVRLPVRFLDHLMPGTVALPHGWGHQPADGLSVARRTAGVNVNILSADGPDNIERLSGMAHLTGIPVEVVPARGPHDPHSWSGIPEG